MEWAIGTVVYALRGRDRGKAMCVVGKSETRVFVCDGKERKLSKPKPKNPKHLQRTEQVLASEQMRSDRAIKQALKSFSEV
ncbi:MAG: KOW domain-containing protein [Candidatus Fimenecus sp.]